MAVGALFTTLSYYIGSQLIMAYNLLVQVLIGRYERSGTFRQIRRLFDVRYRRTPPHLSDDTQVVCCNHRTHADFFVDNDVLDGRGCTLARWAVFLACPVSSVYALLTKQIRFFRRVRGSRAAVDAHIGAVAAHRRVLILYPEGTRNRTDCILPLKKGALTIVYERNLRLQIMHVANKQRVLDERRMTVQTGVCCHVRLSPPIDPSHYADFDAFFDTIVAEWSRLWDEASSARPDSADAPCHADRADEAVHHPDQHMLCPPIGLRLAVLGALVAGAYLTDPLTLWGIPLYVWCVHVAYGGLVACARYIAPIDAATVRAFARVYNHLQVFASLYMAYLGWQCLDTRDPFFIHDADEATYVKVRWLLTVHPCSDQKLRDFAPTT